MIKKFFKKSNKISQKGFGIIEIILVSTIGIILFMSFEQYLNLSLKAAMLDTDQEEAVYRLGGILEQARAVRDEDWNNIFSPSVDGAGKYHFTNSGVSPDKWVAAAGLITDGQYTIWVKNYSVDRDGDKNIVPSGSGTPDAGTIKITASVSWLVNGATKQVDLSEYLTNFK